MNWKLYLISILVAIAGGFAGGYSRRKVEVLELEKKIYIQKEAETVVVTRWKDRVVTVEKIVRPDGTIEERTIEAEKEVVEEFQRKDREISELKEKLSRKETTPILATYSLGLELPLKFSEERTISYSVGDVSPRVGVRLFGPLWLEGGFHPATGTVTLGGRYEF